MIEKTVVGGRPAFLITAILLVAGFLATSVASYLVSKETVRESLITSDLPLTSDNIYSEIQKDLIRPIFVSSVMASDTFLRDWVLDGENDPERMVKFLAEIQTRYDAVTSFFISERTRNYYHPKGIVQRVSADDPEDIWYFRVRGLTDPYEVNVDVDQANDRAWTIFINYRVLDYDGSFIGVTGVGLTVDAVQTLIRGYREKYQRNIYFLDIGGNLQSINAFGPATPEVGDMDGLETIRAQIIVGDNGTFEYCADGQTYLVNSRFIPELRWFLVVEQEMGREIRDIRNTLLLNLAVCLVITVAVLWGLRVTHGGYEKRLLEMATRDPLTRLLNRQTFEPVLAQALAQARRTNEPLTLILFDIDHFKQINDRLGHLHGDDVLREVAELARHSLRAADTLCRWGGEEFLVLLRDCDLESARAIGEKLRLAVATAEKIDSPVTISLGLAAWRTDEAGEALIARADEAMYRAKRNGRNRLEIG